jgi:subtilisin-like proprotein convertase family protein
VAPCNVTSITVEVWGGGGAGGVGDQQNNNNKAAGGGGGGGGYSTANIPVNPGQTFTYTVGAGALLSGNNGGDTDFGGLVSATGGQGGTNANSSTSGTGGTGTSSNGADGGNGISGGSTSTSGAGGNAGGTGGGTGGASVNSGNGNNGTAPGGGGSGGAGKNAIGGDGGDGQVTITYTVDPSITCISNTTNTTINDVCANNYIWTDGGGVSGSYGNNESYTYTFCPGSPGQSVQVSFSSYDSEGGGGVCTDFLELWMANNNTGTSSGIYCTNLGSFTVTSASPDGCVTFEFTSDGSTEGDGWVAEVSCVTGCVPPTAGLVDASTLNLCPIGADTPDNPTVSFDGSASSAASGFSLSSYQWDFGDGSLDTTASASTTHTYSPGIYIASLSVRDDNTTIDPLGCQSTNSVTKVVRILPEPANIGATPSPLAAICPTCVDMTAVGTSRNFTEELPQPATTVTLLPDGAGNSYESTADYSGLFPPGATMTAGCYPDICFNLEHSYSGDLLIELVAPDGTAMTLYDQDGSNINFGNCSNGADDETQGCGIEYCVSATATNNWGDVGMLSTPPANGSCVYTGACEGGDNYTSGTYLPNGGAFGDLNGAQLNGIWKIRITDFLSADDGFLFSWNLTFPESCYRNLETATPDISSVIWQTHTGGGPSVPLPGSQTQSSFTITDPGPDPCPGTLTCAGDSVSNTINLCFPVGSSNSYDYDYIITDEFGCEYTKILTVDINCPLPVDLLEWYGEAFKGFNRLYWKTASEQDNSHFNILHSTDGNNWRVIDDIEGSGSSSSTTSYSIDHDYPPNGLNYYKLVQVDCDGTETDYNVIGINNDINLVLIKRINSMGQEVGANYKGIVFEYYSDGSVRKTYRD